jgi:putative acetyltransferase
VGTIGGAVIIRDENQADLDAIHKLVAAVFQRPDEAVLVDRLRSDGACAISLVAVEGDEIVGHILFSRMTAPFRALDLGPVSVKPSRQHCGTGSLLIRTGLDQAGEAGWQGDSFSATRNSTAVSDLILTSQVVSCAVIRDRT